jgi:hypothetical protein
MDLNCQIQGRSKFRDCTVYLMHAWTFAECAYNLVTQMSCVSKCEIEIETFNYHLFTHTTVLQINLKSY